jgi:hypothetical protein
MVIVFENSITKPSSGRRTLVGTPLREPRPSGWLLGPAVGGSLASVDSSDPANLDGDGHRPEVA